MSSCNREVDSRPNFIIIFADDLGYGDLGSFGHPTIHTPHLDQMAREGMRLTQFYVAASICTPSRAGLLTGKLPVRTGMTGSRGVLFPDSGGGLQATETTLAEVLQENQYRTACIGKWHLGHLPAYLPNQHGFDYYFGIPYSNDMSPEHNNWDYAKAIFPPTPLIEQNTVIEVEPDQAFLTKRYTDKTLDFITTNKDNPFFIYLAHTFPHTPLHVEEEWTGKSKRGTYGDVVEVLDWSVGQILKQLRQLNLDRKTFVLFTSDNGPWGWAGIDGGSAGLLKGKKGSPWEGGFRVPAIAWMPGKVPANTRSEAIATTMDIFPTFLDMASVSSPVDHLNGKSIRATFLDNRAVQDEVFYYRNDQLVAYRKGPWKIFVEDPNPWNEDITEDDLPLLYQVEEDPSEQFNQAEAHPDVIEKLYKTIQRHIEKTEVVPSQLDSIHIDYQSKVEAFARNRQG
ncbi:MAG: sulfatase [Saprospiraceae bacterium]|nr:sulfatase [Saprospiraceae bacterium]